MNLVAGSVISLDVGQFLLGLAEAFVGVQIQQHAGAFALGVGEKLFSDHCLHGKNLTRFKIFGNPFLILRARQLFLEIHDLFDLHQKPPVNLGEVENLLDAEAGAQGVADEEDALGVGHA